MSLRIKKLTTEEIKSKFLHTESIPYGFDKQVRAECYSVLGPPYYRFDTRYWRSIITPTAKWQVKDMILYTTSESDLSLITSAVLKKTVTK